MQDNAILLRLAPEFTNDLGIVRWVARCPLQIDDFDAYRAENAPCNAGRQAWCCFRHGYRKTLRRTESRLVFEYIGNVGQIIFVYD